MKVYEIVAATNNLGKIKEIKAILEEYNVLSLKEAGVFIDVKEDKDTFIGNATKKAEEIAKELKCCCIADDSGICIEAFEGWPGVFTHRWIEGTDRERNLAIISKMKGIPKDKRKVKWITSIVLSNGKRNFIAEEVIEGFVAENIRGENGFGFDEIFELEDGRTLAELSINEKNQISPRKKAIEKVKLLIKNTYYN